MCTRIVATLTALFNVIVLGFCVALGISHHGRDRTQPVHTHADAALRDVAFECAFLQFSAEKVLMGLRSGTWDGHVLFARGELQRISVLLSTFVMEGDRSDEVLPTCAALSGVPFRNAVELFDIGEEMVYLTVERLGYVNARDVVQLMIPATYTPPTPSARALRVLHTRHRTPPS